MLKILQAPNKILSTPAKPISTVDKLITTLIDEMEQTLIKTSDPEGVGLAAPQIGKSLQLFIIKQTPKSPTLVFINPKVVEYTKTAIEDKDINNEQKESKGVKLEGCLSLHNIWGEVKRHPELVLSYLDEKGQSHNKKFNGFLATIIQHEYDHLQGILFPKRVLEQNGQLYKSRKNTKGEMEFDEISI